MTQTRIVGFDPAVPADQILAHPHNPKRHPGSQREIMRGLMDEFGWLAPMIVNVQTQHLIDGHMRVEEEISRGGTVPVIYIDVPEEAEPTILATFDPIRALAEQDNDNLGWVLDEANSEDERLQQFLDSLRPGETVLPEHEWQGMPEFVQDGLIERQIVVKFVNGDDVALFAEAIGQNITSDTKSIWYPSRDRNATTNLAYVSDEP